MNLNNLICIIQKKVVHKCQSSIYPRAVGCSFFPGWLLVSCYRSVYGPTFPLTIPILLLALFRQVKFYREIVRLWDSLHKYLIYRVLYLPKSLKESQSLIVNMRSSKENLYIIYTALQTLSEYASFPFHHPATAKYPLNILPLSILQKAISLLSQKSADTKITDFVRFLAEKLAYSKKM